MEQAPPLRSISIGGSYCTIGRLESLISCSINVHLQPGFEYEEMKAHHVGISVVLRAPRVATKVARQGSLRAHFCHTPIVFNEGYASPLRRKA
jgi:hypothetical protein